MFDSHGQPHVRLPMFDSHGQPQHAGGMELHRIPFPFSGGMQLPYSCSTPTASLSMHSSQDYVFTWQHCDQTLQFAGGRSMLFSSSVLMLLTRRLVRHDDWDTSPKLCFQRLPAHIAYIPALPALGLVLERAHCCRLQHTDTGFSTWTHTTRVWFSLGES